LYVFSELDLNASLALLAPDPDVVFIGTGGDGKRIGLAEIKALFGRDFAQFEDASLKLAWPSVSAAWVVADLILRAKTGGREISLQARLPCWSGGKIGDSLYSHTRPCRLPGKQRVKHSRHSTMHYPG
jgi:hypothetical protein